MPFEPELNGVTVTKSSLGILAFVTNFSLNSGIGIGFFFFFFLIKKKEKGGGIVLISLYSHAKCITRGISQSGHQHSLADLTNTPIP